LALLLDLGSSGEDALFTLGVTGCLGEFDIDSIDDNTGPSGEGVGPGVEGAEGARSGVDGMLLRSRCIHFFTKSPVIPMPSSMY
jgi:hypothetical protein